MRRDCLKSRGGTEFLGVKKGLVEVLEALRDGGRRRYEEILSSTNLPPATLVMRLKELQVLGLVRKDVENNPGRVQIWYQITDKGVRVLNILKEAEEALKA
jgi:DNA-binding HxlR family transcriptional regulator